MTTRFAAAFVLLFAASPVFAGGGLLAEIDRFTDLFDGGRADLVEVSPPPSMPMPRGEDGLSEDSWWKTLPMLPQPKSGDWSLPRINGVPIESSDKHRDVLKGLAPCQAVDFVYYQQPTVAQTLRSLTDCLGALTERYGVEITAAEGRGGIVLMISGIVPPGSTVKADLETALQLRGGKIFGHEAVLVDLQRPASDLKTSSLQPIVERCEAPAGGVRDAAEFVRAYSDCVLGAKGLTITGLRADPKESDLVLVYSRDPRHLIREMTGVVRVAGPNGAARLRIHAESEILSDRMIETGLGLPVALPQ